MIISDFYRYLKIKLNDNSSFDRIENWQKNNNIFFILSIGRSGTKFLSNLLNTSSNSLVVHEPMGKIDHIAYQIAYWDELRAKKHIENFRKYEIKNRILRSEINTYGEVNSLLRRHVNVLKKAFPNATILHLVRDGRDVVRSMLSRKTMLPFDLNTLTIAPKGEKIINWKFTTSRFEKLCWYWKAENNYLFNHIDNLIRLEDILTSYQYFEENVLCRIKINIEKSTWKKMVNKPKNTTKEYKIENWENWPSDLLKIFDKLCSKEMIKYGYEYK
jgi:hypothetical protein